MQPDPQAAQSAYSALVEYGIVGAVLAIVLLSAIALVWWLLKTTNTTLKEKDELINTIQERRIVGATEAIQVSSDNAKKMDEVLGALETLIRLQGGR